MSGEWEKDVWYSRKEVYGTVERSLKLIVSYRGYIVFLDEEWYAFDEQHQFTCIVDPPVFANLVAIKFIGPTSNDPLKGIRYATA